MQGNMHVGEIWLYPIKSMRGHQVQSAEVLSTGLAGDRSIVVVSRASGHVITARTHPALLGLEPMVGADHSISIKGYDWQSREARVLVSETVQENVELVNLKEDTDRFDILPLLVATDGAINALGIDRRRLRPNIIVTGAGPTEERAWPGRDLQLGPVVIHAAQLRMRCVMTTFDPDTLQQDRNVLRRIVSEMGGKTALDCSVSRPGLLRIGDPVQVITTQETTQSKETAA